MKKPIPVEAMQYHHNSECLCQLQSWMGESFKSSGIYKDSTQGWLGIATLEDGTGLQKVKHIASEGDYILKGPFGEFWAVKPEIFQLTYEEVV